jgi:uncharacterized membrane protein (UPF0127 family)
MRFLVLVVALAACTPPANGTSPPKEVAPNAQAEMRPERATVVISTPDGDKSFTVELAITGPERNKGLMFREQMAEDAGMLFLFEEMRIQSFWMKNTRLPLDMYFIDEDFVIVGIVENAEPMTTSSRKVNKPSRYVLELNGGATRKLGLAVGQKVRFEGVPPHLIQKKKVTP